jgi:hypothetical protein
MKQIVIVLNSDSVNLYGSRFSVGALHEGLFEECLCGIPILVAHDASRLIGWSRPLALYFEPGLTRLVGIGELAEKDDDHEWLRRFFTYRLQKDLDSFQPEIEELRDELQGNLRGQEKLIHSECIALVEPELASKVFPALFALQDKDGLISLKHLDPLGPGVYQIGKLAIFAHPFFRRALYRLNTLNYPLLQALQTLNSESVKIALDPDMIGLASTYIGGREELVYWWGPKFDDDLTSIPSGVTHHEAEETERIFYGISATQFRWGKIDNHHVFEAEELRDVPTASSKEQKYGCRYVHSMVAEKTGRIEHLDGSVRMYSEEAMLERLSTDIAHAGRHTEYTKIWCIDDTIPISEWKRLLSDYFRDNFLVGEYLGAEKLDKSIWGAKEQDVSLFNQYAPFSITPDMGIRLTLSIHPRTEDANSSVRVVKPFDIITDGLTEHPYVETFTLELKKALSRSGANLVIPEGTGFVSFKDFYINLPMVYHPEDGTQQSIKQSLRAITTLVNALRAKEKDWILSYNIAFPLDKDREVRISTLGHIDVLAKWLENPLSCPPVINDELLEWSEKVADFLRSAYPEDIDHARIFSVLMTSGILLINRKRIEAKDFQVMYSEEDKRFEFKLAFDKAGQDLLEKLLAIGIRPSLGWLIEKSECDGCGQPYEECGCSKLLDKGIAQRIVKALPFPFWTDRPL